MKGEPFSAHYFAVYSYFTMQKNILERGGNLPLLDLCRAASANIPPVEYKDSTYNKVVHILNPQFIEKYNNTDALKAFGWLETMYVPSERNLFALQAINVVAMQEAKYLEIVQGMFCRLELEGIDEVVKKTVQAPNLASFIEGFVEAINYCVPPYGIITLTQADTLLEIFTSLNEGPGVIAIQNILEAKHEIFLKNFKYGFLGGGFAGAQKALLDKRTEVEFFFLAQKEILRTLNFEDSSEQLKKEIGRSLHLERLIEEVIKAANESVASSAVTEWQVYSLTQALEKLNKGPGTALVEKILKEKKVSSNDLYYPHLKGDYEEARRALIHKESALREKKGK